MTKSPFGNLGGMMKQAQVLQDQLAKLKDEVATKTVQASAGGGMVEVTANGAQEIISIRIDPEVMKDQDIDMLQDLVISATNEALRKSRELMADELKGLTGGMQIPGLF
ncbi:MAG TPA: YbaB/EbfC family nucleoid-associated protein [Nitrospirales bacterium]|nr:YbaB/EbfC family nucleoid-associated protein [Nitrospirales bacterium]